MDSACSQLPPPSQQNSFRIDNLIGPGTHHDNTHQFTKPFTNFFCQEEPRELKRESISSTEDDESDSFRKKKKPRTAFSREQVTELEKKFTERKYLSSAERGELAEKLKLSDMQVKTWFQNRRMKYKRQTEEAELEVKSPKFSYHTPFVSYSSLYNYMHYKTTDGLPSYSYNPPESCRPQSSTTADSYSFSPTPQISPNYFGSVHNGGIFTPLSPATPVSSSYQVGGYINGDYNMIPYNIDWHRSLPTPPAP